MAVMRVIPAFEAINSVALCLMVCVFELANIFLLPQHTWIGLLQLERSCNVSMKVLYQCAVRAGKVATGRLEVAKQCHGSL